MASTWKAREEERKSADAIQLRLLLFDLLLFDVSTHLSDHVGKLLSDDGLTDKRLSEDLPLVRPDETLLDGHPGGSSRRAAHHPTLVVEV